MMKAPVLVVMGLVFSCGMFAKDWEIVQDESGTHVKLSDRCVRRSSRTRDSMPIEEVEAIMEIFQVSRDTVMSAFAASHGGYEETAMIVADWTFGRDELRNNANENNVIENR
ncbi:MAG: hypothetical protein LBQ43_03965 [Holosporales bacterium]|jgi:hypothetical protein|nr:hypothetical protein [Holosporales bacterium]